jgi:hypothetical protein
MMPIGFEYLDMNRQQAEIERITDQVMNELIAKNQDLGYSWPDVSGGISKLAKASGNDGYGARVVALSAAMGTTASQDLKDKVTALLKNVHVLEIKKMIHDEGAGPGHRARVDALNNLLSRCVQDPADTNAWNTLQEKLEHND